MMFTKPVRGIANPEGSDDEKRAEASANNETGASLRLNAMRSRLSVRSHLARTMYWWLHHSHCCVDDMQLVEGFGTCKARLCGKVWGTRFSIALFKALLLQDFHGWCEGGAHPTLCVYTTRVMLRVRFASYGHNFDGKIKFTIGSVGLGEYSIWRGIISILGVKQVTPDSNEVLNVKSNSRFDDFKKVISSP